MRVTFNADHQPSRPYHGLKLDGVHLGRHIERCEHIRSETEPVIQANPPATYIRRAVSFVRSITAAQHLSRGLNAGAQDVGDYNQYYMRPEAHREMSKRTDCLSLRLSCLEITVTSSKLSDQDYEVAMKELHEVRGGH